MDTLVHGDAASTAREPLAVRIEAVRDLTAPEREAMYALYAAHYDCADALAFQADLDEKDRVLRVRSEDGTLRGFTTMAVRDHEIDGRPCRSVFSGDTIMHPLYWGRQDLAFNWLRFAGTVKAGRPDVPLYWFLIVKGHRTYRYLSAFSLSFYPHWAEATPAWARNAMDALARERFGRHYDAARGVLAFPSSRGHLSDGLAAVSEAERRRPDVAHFLALNPGYVRGEELVCLCELDEANLRPVARRQFALGLRG